MLQSPATAVIGATDPASTIAFLHVLDLTPVGKLSIGADAAAGLYGVSEPLELTVLRAADRLAGSVHVVGPVPARPSVGPYATGPHAYDLYTRDIERSLQRLGDAGYAHGPVGHVELGPLVMDQMMVTGPDELTVVLIESQRRRPSLLDDDDDRLHSEGHSFIWAVDSIDVALPFWREATGLTVPFDAPVRHPEVNRFMQLPDADVSLRMAMICDEDVTPMRLELLEFLDVPVGVPTASGATASLTAGLHAPQFNVADIDLVRSELSGASFGEIVKLPLPDRGAVRACYGVAPGGIRFELVEVSG